MSLTYSVREGLAGFSRAKFAVFTAVSAMAVALMLIGLFTLVGYQAQQVSNWLRQKVSEVDVFLLDVEPDLAGALRDRIAVMRGVENATFISKEQAADIFLEDFGEEGDVFLGTDEPFLPASIKVQVDRRYANPDSLVALARQIEKYDFVDEAVYNRPALVTVQENLRLITWIGVVLGALVVLAALFLVSNTIRLTIYARRMLIRTMKLVGATDGFIRQPFLVEGVAQGFLAGVFGGVILLAAYRGLVSYIPQLSAQPWPGGSPLVVMTFLVILGMFLGWLGSFFAVRRFIKHVTLHG